MINVFQPSLGEEELSAIRDVFQSNWIGRGKITESFGKAFSEYQGISPANVLSVNSCTEGIFVAMDLLAIGVRDEVIMPSISFVGAANAVASHGARPVFCDV